jgi:predicted dehydrogenase
MSGGFASKHVLTAGLPVPVAVIGCGHFGAYHAKHYANNPSAVLVAIVDPDPRAQQFSKKMGVPWFSHIDDLPDSVHAVSVAIPSLQNAAVATELLGRGLHVLLEKPMAHNLADADYLVDVAARHKRILHIGHLERYNPVVRYLASQPNQAIEHLEFVRTGSMVSRAAGNNLVLDLMIHDIDLAQFFMRDTPQTVELLHSSTHSELQVAVRLSFRNGASAYLSANRSPSTLSRHINLTMGESIYRLDLTASSLSRIAIDGCDVPAKTLVFSGDALGYEIDTFLNAVKGLTHEGVTGQHARGSLKIALKILALLDHESHTIS